MGFDNCPYHDDLRDKLSNICNEIKALTNRLYSLKCDAYCTRIENLENCVKEIRGEHEDVRREIHNLNKEIWIAKGAFFVIAAIGSLFGSFIAKFVFSK